MSRILVYGLVTALVAVALLVPGIGNLAHHPHIAEDMAQMGYSAFFLTILGTWKLIGAAAVLVPGAPRLKEWAYAGMVFDLTGAAASRVATGGGLADILPPLVICGFVALSWALRPASRRL